MTGFDEEKLEQAIIELFDAEGYPHVCGETIDRRPMEAV